jgi:hypothetical protein
MGFFLSLSLYSFDSDHFIGTEYFHSSPPSLPPFFLTLLLLLLLFLRWSLRLTSNSPFSWLSYLSKVNCGLCASLCQLLCINASEEAVL